MFSGMGAKGLWREGTGGGRMRTRCMGGYGGVARAGYGGEVAGDNCNGVGLMGWGGGGECGVVWVRNTCTRARYTPSRNSRGVPQTRRPTGVLPVPFSEERSASSHGPGSWALAAQDRARQPYSVQSRAPVVGRCACSPWHTAGDPTARQIERYSVTTCSGSTAPANSTPPVPVPPLFRPAAALPR